MTVLITLTIAVTDAGPFDLYSNLDGFTIPFQTGISKASLVAGYSSNVVPDLTSIIRVKSTGVCTNFSDFPISGVTTTTSTSSTTTTTTTSGVVLPTLTNPNACFPGSPSGQVTITGGTIGETVLVRLNYVGQVGTDGASASVSAHASLNSVSATPVCYSANTSTHIFNLTVDVLIVLTGSPLTVPTSVFYRNGTSFTLFNKYVQVIAYNGNPVSGDQLGTICSGNDGGPGC